MPKKTRQEKVLAAYRKKLRLLEQMNQPLTPEVVSSSAKNAAIEKPSFVKIEEKPTIDREETLLKTFFIKDLRKSLLLVGLIIALEIIIYFGTINHYFKL